MQVYCEKKKEELRYRLVLPELVLSWTNEHPVDHRAMLRRIIVRAFASTGRVNCIFIVCIYCVRWEQVKSKELVKIWIKLMCTRPRASAESCECAHTFSTLTHQFQSTNTHTHIQIWGECSLVCLNWVIQMWPEGGHMCDRIRFSICHPPR